MSRPVLGHIEHDCLFRIADGDGDGAGASADPGADADGDCDADGGYDGEPDMRRRGVSCQS